MGLKERIADDLKTAMKGGDKLRTGVIRMVRSRLQEAEVARRGKEGRDYVLTDEETTAVVSAYGKQRRDSIDSYRDGGREDLAVKEEAELAILQDYLPEPIGPEQLKKIIQEAIGECGATSPRDLGKVMQLVMPRVKGAADGKTVNQIARELLTSS